jgi:hypothetical protein
MSITCLPVLLCSSLADSILWLYLSPFSSFSHEVNHNYLFLNHNCCVTLSLFNFFPRLTSSATVSIDRICLVFLLPHLDSSYALKTLLDLLHSDSSMLFIQPQLLDSMLISLPDLLNHLNPRPSHCIRLKAFDKTLQEYWHFRWDANPQYSLVHLSPCTVVVVVVCK